MKPEIIQILKTQIRESSEGKAVIKAFTLVEITLVLSIIAIIALVTVPLTGSWQNAEEIELVSLNVVDALRSAQSKSKFGVDGDIWSVKIEQTRVIVYKGSDYPNRDINFDDEIFFTQTVLVGGNSDISFLANSGRLENPMSTQLTIADKTWQITVSKLGVISY